MDSYLDCSTRSGGTEGSDPLSSSGESYETRWPVKKFHPLRTPRTPDARVRGNQPLQRRDGRAKDGLIDNALLLNLLEEFSEEGTSGRLSKQKRANSNADSRGYQAGSKARHTRFDFRT
jgi:hypothetical protein